MSRRVVGRFALPTLALLAFAIAGTSLEAGPSDAHTRLSVARVLERLPNNGAFDLLMFAVDRGTVTLDGYAHQTELVAEAVAAIERMDGVTRVDTKVQPLPTSAQDDWIRQALFQRIYTDDFVARYAATSHGHHAIAGFPDFPGMTAAGRYQIHIVVRNGHVALFGIVNSDADRQEATLRAQAVIGTFAVDNHLIVSAD
jgi:osmotically-inducible protein OsmY